MIAEAALQMSVLTAVLELRAARPNYEGQAWNEIAVLLSARGMASLDFERAISLNQELQWLEHAPNSSRTTQLREIVKSVLQLSQPSWLAAIPRGLNLVRETADIDVLQVLDCCELLGDPIERAAVEWWDEFAIQIRNDAESRRVAQGRYAEQLSLQLEEATLAGLGLGTYTPRWVAVDDNSLGYDVLSFRLLPDGVVQEIFIEVKSTSRGKVSFYVTRNEWRRACNAPDRYFFHVWALATETPIILTAADVATHIPVDSGDGSWQDVFIELK
jgi:hypothetical protein